MLAMALSASMVAVAAVSVSADTDEDGYYQPSEGTDTYRYYFYMPQDWENEYTTTTGAYWWEGTDSCPTWQDMYKIHETENENIFYIDAPTDVTKIIFNNYVDGGEDPEAGQYTKAAQTTDITCVNSDGDEAWGYWPGADGFDPDNEMYPDGIRDFNNMIYVIDQERIDINPLNQKKTCVGQWYYYYGNGQYGYEPVKGEGAIYNTEYMSIEQALEDWKNHVVPSEPTTEATEATTEATEATTEATEATEATTAPAPAQKPALTVNATSNVFPSAKAEYDNSTKKVTVTYYLGLDRKLVNCEWYLTFDPSVLEYKNANNLNEDGDALTIMPQITSKGGDVINTKLPGKINANASSLKLYKIDPEQPFVQVNFDVVGEPENVETTIDLNVRVLTTGDINPDTMQLDSSSMNSFVVDYKVVDESPIQSRKTTLTESTFIPSTEPTTEAVETTATTEATEPEVTTTPAPATSAPVPATSAPAPATSAPAPATTAPAPATTAPASSDPATTVDPASTVTPDATSATGATVKPGTSDTATKGNTTTNDNGTVKTGDATLAVVILTLLVSATGVMFVIRKREML